LHLFQRKKGRVYIPSEELQKQEKVSASASEGSTEIPSHSRLAYTPMGAPSASYIRHQVNLVPIGFSQDFSRVDFEAKVADLDWLKNTCPSLTPEQFEEYIDILEKLTGYAPFMESFENSLKMV
jgi:hypothetical protein